MPTEITNYINQKELALRVENIETKDAIGRKIIQILRTSEFTNEVDELWTADLGINDKATYLILYEQKS